MLSSYATTVDKAGLCEHCSAHRSCLVMESLVNLARASLRFVGFLTAFILLQATGPVRSQVASIPELHLNACTLLGCTSQVRIHVRSADGKIQHPPRKFRIEIEGRVVECTEPHDIVELGGCNDGEINVVMRETSACDTEQQSYALSAQCKGTGRFEDAVLIQGTPSVLRVIVKSAEKTIADRTIRPSYKSNRPNGPDCEPACTDGEAVLVLP